METREIPRGLISFALDKMPTTEHVEAITLIRQLEMLGDYRSVFYFALRLFEESEIALHAEIKKMSDPSHDGSNRMGLWTAFQRIACRDAAMTIYHFGVVLDSLMKRFAACKSWHDRVDRKSLYTVQPEFKKSFPVAERMRHAVGHEAELMKSPESFRENAVGGHLMFRGNIAERRFSMTMKGQIAYLNMTVETLNKLHEIEQTALEAFRPLARPQ